MSEHIWSAFGSPIYETLYRSHFSLLPLHGSQLIAFRARLAGGRPFAGCESDGDIERWGDLVGWVLRDCFLELEGVWFVSPSSIVADAVYGLKQHGPESFVFVHRTAG